MTNKSSNHTKYTNNNPLKRYLIKGFIQKFLTLADFKEGDRICDLGCGEGFVISEIVKDCPGVVVEGYDISEPALAVARERVPGVKFSQLDIYNASKLADNSYDTVLAMEILEHLDEYPKALNEIAQLDFEHVVISVPNEPYFSWGNLLIGKNAARLGKDPEHVNFWNEKTFSKVLSNYFTIVETAKPFPWLMFKCKKK